MAKRNTGQIVAELFALVDSAGKPRALLQMDTTTDMPSLTLYDKEGLDRIVIGLGEHGGPGISLRRVDGSTALSIGLKEGEEGVWGLTIQHPNAAPAFCAKAHASGHIQIEAYDAIGNCILKASTL